MISISSAPTDSVIVRRSNERGSTLLHWLNSQHTFSFGDYIDPNHMGFRDLRVVNEDRVAGGAGFPTHQHQSVEIFIYVIDGALHHRDSLGNIEVIGAGQLQYIKTGSGITHSEMNASEKDPVHFLQIWLQSQTLDDEPSYDLLDPGASLNLHGLVLLASPDGEDGAIKIKQDAEIYLGHLSEESAITIEKNESRPHFWVQLISGSLDFGSVSLRAGDGYACHSCSPSAVRATEDCEFLLFCLR